MDKYTVDLDKVLNDFEYSELTDSQQNLTQPKSNSSISTGSIPTQITNVFPSTSQQSQHKIKNVNSKHSITNVFNSLNEYLNSDIGIGKEKNALHLNENKSNELLKRSYDNKVQFNSLNLANNQADKENIYKDIVIATDTKKHEEFSEEAKDLITGSPQKNFDLEVSLQVEKDYLEEPEPLIDIVPDQTNLVEVPVELEQPFPKDASVEKEGIGILPEETKEIVGEASNIDEELKVEESKPNLEEPIKVEQELDIDDVESQQVIPEIEIVIEESNLEVDKLKLEVGESKDNTEKQEPEEIERIAEDILEESKEIEEEVLQEVDSKQEILATSVVVGDQIDKDCAERRDSNDVVEEKAVIESNDSDDLKVPNRSIGFDDTFDIDESELDKYLDEIENEYQNKTEKSEPLEVDVEKMNSEITAVTEDTSNKENDVSETIPSEEIGSGSSEDLNSSGRPRTLELSNDSSESKREINLIGEPGSTPYNNVYVSKELPANPNEAPTQSETDSSCSVSPTFSNVSTESIHSSSSSDTSTDPADKEERYPVRTAQQEPLETKCDTVVQVYGANDNDNNKCKQNSGDNEPADCAGSNVNTENSSNNNGLVTERAENSNSGQSDNDNNETTAHPESAGDVSLTKSEDTPNPCDNSVGLGEGDSEVVGAMASSLEENPIPSDSGAVSWLGKQAPLWIPDSEALSCLHCDARFTVIKRRHHCRACGLVLCSKCCNLKYKLDYLDAEARVCFKCYDILNRDTNSSSGSEAVSPASGNSPSRNSQQPNPNNPMEYCSVVPPLQQVSNVNQNPPTVMVPVGVLKRKGSSKGKSNKSVMFCDGIRPGSDLTNLDNDFSYNEGRSSHSSLKKSSPSSQQQNQPAAKSNKNFPLVDAVSKSFIPSADNSLPPTVTLFKSDISYSDCANSANVVEMLKNETLIFAIHRNLYVHVRIINMACCIKKTAWCFSTEGLISVGQDEVVFLVECLPNEISVPKDLFYHINNIYNDAVKGTTVTEMGISLHPTQNFLDSKNHAGFLYIRPTFQCLQNVIIPKEPYLVGILIHRWETPWAKIFPLRLVLRLGAEYRYYPSPIISTRNRESVFVEIGHTIINLLADFRNFSYTLPNIRGLTIHMEDKNTTITIPTNRYDQVMKSLNNSSDHILAFAGNFSSKADSHLVCIQDTQGSNENSYTTHAINIQNKPRKITGASFIVFNGALKSTSGLTAKSSIVEDGLMIQIPAEHMVQVRESLRNMKNHTIQCGCVNAVSDETVNIIWGEADVNFNINVLSPIDKQPLSGIPSIRVHNGKDFVCNSGNRLIRWTEVFILQNGDENARTQQDPVDISKLAESISKATCHALVKYLDLLASNNFYKVGIRTMLHVENVSYSAGSNGLKLPPIYMRSLDNELIPVLHRITSNNLGENAIVLELIFRILNV